MSKKSTNNNCNVTTNNRYEDLFGNSAGNQTTKNTVTNQQQQKDPFDFVLDYDQSFLRDDHNKHNVDNQFNTRRSRSVMIQYTLIIKIHIEWKLTIQNKNLSADL